MATIEPLFEFARVRDYAPGEGLAAGAAAPGTDPDGWIEVPVPGDVHCALVAAGRMEPPFYDRNENDCAWMEEREWWYRARFAGPRPAGPDERLRLILYGLDTFATVYLNGEPLGRHANMFRPVAFDVTAAVLPAQENVLAICFDPPLQHVGTDRPDQWALFATERVWMRKAQFGYGWDWGPRLPTIGIWRPVELRRERCAAITGVRFATLELPAHGRDALVAATVEVEHFAGVAELEARVELRPPGGGATAETVLAVAGTATAYLTLPDPPLWWTHDLGEPALHELVITLSAAGQQLDVDRRQVGIRTIELDQRPDPEEPGTRLFRFMLNGVPIFARGANWIPADSFVGAIRAERYARLLDQAVAANMNMLRVWGGGIYEHGAFYELCDARGVLVWQDFMFACAAYPERELAAEVELEARAQVARLRTHPSLALWCGNNECQWIHDQQFPERGGERVPGARFYDDVLPRVVADVDGRTAYWPGSPFGGNDHNGREDGDVHNWEVWHGNRPRRFGEPSGSGAPNPERVSYLRYGDDLGRFISEFGTLSAPDRETLRRWIPPDQLHHHSPSLDHHTKDTPKNKIDMLLESVTGVASNLEDFIDFSMMAQAEALKFAIEHYRRRAPHCSGTLIWQLNDSWPGLSWSLLDYHGFAKAAYYFTRRAYAPVLASFRVAADGGVELWITSDATAVADVALVRLRTFAGAVLSEEEVPFELPGPTSHCVRRWGPGTLDGGRDRYLSVRARNAAFPANRWFFAAIKDLDREPGRVEHTCEVSGPRELAVRLRADGYAYFACVGVRDERIRLSDNYIDLEPGEERTIILRGASAPPTPSEITVRSR